MPYFILLNYFKSFLSTSITFAMFILLLVFVLISPAMANKSLLFPALYCCAIFCPDSVSRISLQILLISFSSDICIQSLASAISLGELLFPNISCRTSFAKFRFISSLSSMSISSPKCPAVIGHSGRSILFLLHAVNSSLIKMLDMSFEDLFGLDAMMSVKYLCSTGSFCGFKLKLKST